MNEERNTLDQKKVPEQTPEEEMGRKNPLEERCRGKSSGETIVRHTPSLDVNLTSQETLATELPSHKFRQLDARIL
jgi:hypothetical protein